MFLTFKIFLNLFNEEEYVLGPRQKKSDNRHYNKTIQIEIDFAEFCYGCSKLRNANLPKRVILAHFKHCWANQKDKMKKSFVLVHFSNKYQFKKANSEVFHNGNITWFVPNAFLKSGYFSKNDFTGENPLSHQKQRSQCLFILTRNDAFFWKFS